MLDIGKHDITTYKRLMTRGSQKERMAGGRTRDETWCQHLMMNFLFVSFFISQDTMYGKCADTHFTLFYSRFFFFFLI